MSGRFPLTDEEMRKLKCINRDKEALEKMTAKLVEELNKLGQKVKGDELDFWENVLTVRGLEPDAPVSIDLNKKELVVQSQEDNGSSQLRNWNPTGPLQ